LEITKKEALKIWSDSQNNPKPLYKIADELRQSFFGNKVELCSIINAKSGNCSENCSFCAQSAHNNAKAPTYPLVTIDEIVSSSEKAAKLNAHGFGIVTSGDCIDGSKELPQICDAVKRIRKQGLINPDASLGRLNTDMANRLKDSGLVRYHHNLETSEDFFKNICTTHSYKDRVKTVSIAKKTGFQVCCGGLFGLGETPAQRIDFAFMLKELGVDSVPLNFLIPIAGTPLEKQTVLNAEEILMTIAIFRIILKDKHIKVCAGRELNLKDRQSEIFSAGADGMMIGGYLTQGGNPPEQDLKMLKDLGLEPNV